MKLYGGGSGHEMLVLDKGVVTGLGQRFCCWGDWHTEQGNDMISICR